MGNELLKSIDCLSSETIGALSNENNYANISKVKVLFYEFSSTLEQKITWQGAWEKFIASNGIKYKITEHYYNDSTSEISIKIASPKDKNSTSITQWCDSYVNIYDNRAIAYDEYHKALYKSLI